jgi:hypothetical protein
MYDAKLGRFISRDPILLANGPNPYGYCTDSPEQFEDPLGLQLEADGVMRYFPYLPSKPEPPELPPPEPPGPGPSQWRLLGPGIAAALMLYEAARPKGMTMNPYPAVTGPIPGVRGGQHQNPCVLRAGWSTSPRYYFASWTGIELVSVQFNLILIWDGCDVKRAILGLEGRGTWFRSWSGTGVDINVRPLSLPPTTPARCDCCKTVARGSFMASVRYKASFTMEDFGQVQVTFDGNGFVQWVGSGFQGWDNSASSTGLFPAAAGANGA